MNYKDIKCIAILAAGPSGEIGIGNELFYHNSLDMAMFKARTYGYPVIMGKNTFYSMHCIPLAGRYNIVLSTTMGNPDDENSSLVVERSFFNAIKTAKRICMENNYDRFFIIGGAMLYNDCFEYKIADEIYLSKFPTGLTMHDDIKFVNLDTLEANYSCDNMEPIHCQKPEDTSAFVLYHYTRRML